MQGLVCPEGPSMTVGVSSESGKNHFFLSRKRTYFPGPLLTPLGIGIGIRYWWVCLNAIGWKEMRTWLDSVGLFPRCVSHHSWLGRECVWGASPPPVWDKALIFFMSQVAINIHYIVRASLKLTVRPQVLGILIGARYHTHFKTEISPAC